MAGMMGGMGGGRRGGNRFGRQVDMPKSSARARDKRWEKMNSHHPENRARLSSLQKLR